MGWRSGAVTVLAGVTILALAALPVGATSAAPSGPPVLGASILLEPVSGVLRVRVPGSPVYEPLDAARLVPVHTRIDARRGRVRVTSATDTYGAIQSAVFYDSAFSVSQAPGRALTTLTLRGGGLERCGGRAATARRRKRPERHLFGDGKGSFRTAGRLASATIRGTVWRTADTCTGTKIGVRRGVVDVAARRRRTIRLRAGHTVLVPERGPVVPGRTIKLPG